MQHARHRRPQHVEPTPFRVALIALLAIAGMAMFAAPASAHHPLVSGATTCADDGWSVVWTVQPDASRPALTWKVTSPDGYAPAGSQPAVGDSRFTRTTSHPLDVGGVDETVTVVWSNGVVASGSAHVDRPDECRAGTTTTSTTSTTSTTTSTTLAPTTTVAPTTTTPTTTVAPATSTTSTTPVVGQNPPPPPASTTTTTTATATTTVVAQEAPVPTVAGSSTSGANQLPRTGNGPPVGLTLLGAVLVLIGTVMLIRTRRPLVDR